MFHHKHPYGPFIPDGARKLIVGTLPPPRFTQGLLREGDVDFCYGSRDGQLWPILDRIFHLNLDYALTEEAIHQRKNFLEKHHIGICDIVESAWRNKIDASDLGMHSVQIRNVIEYIRDIPTVEMLLFTGGNSKNGPEYFFRRHLKDHALRLEMVSKEVPRIHRFEVEGRQITTVSLLAPSGSANRAVGSLPLYKTLKKKTRK